MRVGNTKYRISFRHDYPQGPINKMGSKTLSTPTAGTTCYLMEYENGDKTDPLIAMGVSTLFRGSETFQAAPDLGPNIFRRVIKKGDRFSKKKGREISLRDALKNSGIPRNEWNEFFKTIEPLK